MGTTLQHGIFLPAEGERNCYTGLASNWTILDGVVGGYSSHAANLTIHVTAADKEAWNGKADASALTAHTGNTTIHVTAADKEAWNGKADASALTAHAGNTTIHVTAADKEAWNGKQDALSQTQLDAVNSGIDSTKVQQIATNTSDISSLQSGKANDNSVVHTSGNETVAGFKTFENIRLTNSIRAIALDEQTADINDCYSSFAQPNSPKNGNVALYSCNTDTSTANITNLPVQKAFYLISITIRYLSNTPTVKQILFTRENIKYERFCNEGIWSNWIKDTDKFVTTDTNQTISGDKTFSSINGVVPSSLGMPDLSNGVDISGYITVVANANKESLYTPPANGWISVALTRSRGASMAVMLKQGNFASSGHNIALENGTTTCNAMLPVKGGVQVSINSALADGIDFAYFYPCQGSI